MHSYPIMNLAEEIYRLRKLVNWTQGELADATGCSIRSINSWETGKIEPKVRSFREIERVCMEKLASNAGSAGSATIEQNSIDKAEDPKYNSKTSHTLEEEDDMRDYLKVFKELLRMKDEEIGRLKAEISLNELKKDSQGEGF